MVLMRMGGLCRIACDDRQTGLGKRSRSCCLAVHDANEQLQLQVRELTAELRVRDQQLERMAHHLLRLDPQALPGDPLVQAFPAPPPPMRQTAVPRNGTRL